MSYNKISKLKANSGRKNKSRGFLNDFFLVVKHEVVGVIGETVAVPCNCTPAYSHLADKPALILWYKDRSKLPIYRWAFSN